MVNTRKGFKLTPTDKDKRIEKLEKENEELKEVINNDVDKKIYVQLVKKDRIGRCAERTTHQSKRNN